MDIEYSKTPIFHVGFPKAGSTTLQNNVFSKLSDTIYFGKYDSDEIQKYEDKLMIGEIPYNKNSSIKKFYREFIIKDGVHYNETRAKNLLNEISHDIGKKLVIFSHEGILNALFAYPDTAVKAERLFRLFGNNLRIFINIRKQKDLIVSWYRHSPFDPFDGGNGKSMSFSEWVKKEKRRKYSSFLDLLNYDRTALLFTELFGSKNVLILPLELMIVNPGLYANKLGDFMGINVAELLNLLTCKPANIGKSTGYNRFLRLRRYIPTELRLRSFIPQFMYNGLLNTLKKGEKEKINVPPDLADYFNQKYAESNQRLAKLTGLDLESLGYDMSADTTK